MKKLYFLLTFLFLAQFAKAQNPDAFITTWEVTDYGIPENIDYRTIRIPVVDDPINNYTVDFGDGTILTNQTGEVTHTYSSSGTYTVTMSGVFKWFRMSGNSRRLKTIEQWGTNVWGSMEESFLNCYNLIINATDIPNLSQVTNMKSMFANCSSMNQSLNDWDVSNVTNMSSMFTMCISFNQPLDNWDVSNVTNMQGMFSPSEAFNQPLNNWNVSNVTNMEWMFAEAIAFNQPLNNWNVSNVNNMGYMFFGASSFNQPLNNWDVSNVTDMSIMFAGTEEFNQPLNNWDVSNVTEIFGMFSYAEAFNQDLSDWNFNSALVLDYFVDNSGLDVVNYDLLLNRFVELELQGRVFNATNLQYCDIITREYLINNLGWAIYEDSLSGNCGDNSITGNILYDENNNGCDVNDVQLNGFFVNATNENTSSSTFSINGEYTLNVYEGTHTINILNLPEYFNTPVDATITLEGSGNTETLDFCVTSNQTIEDLNIVVLPLSEARPGFEATYQLVVQNIGTQTINNISVNLTFDETKQSFVSANLNENSVTSNQLNFEITSLQPFGSSVIDFTMQTFTPPTVNGDDVLNFAATVSPNTNDFTPNDNIFELAQTVVNSYDPNDKLVLQGNEIHIDKIDEYLHYIVRFQNTGTASAVNVRIEDTLHESLDWNTIQIINSSHTFRAEIINGNQVEFIFDNIYLPYQAEDEVGSNGFIAYKIKPIEGTQVGDFITGNEANIYFDFNEAIVTNATSTEVVNETLSVSTHSLNNLISIYPNPTNGILNITSKENLQLEQVKIYNLQGRELFSSSQNLENINIESISSGVYLLNIKTNQGTISKRIIKQ